MAYNQQYKEITKEDYDQFIKENFPKCLEASKEYYQSRSTYEYVDLLILNPQFGVKVYTSISRNTDKTRPNGEDTIRLILVEMDKDNQRRYRKVIQKIHPIRRTPTWRRNFLKRILDIKKEWRIM